MAKKEKIMTQKGTPSLKKWQTSSLTKESNGRKFLNRYNVQLIGEILFTIIRLQCWLNRVAWSVRHKRGAAGTEKRAERIT
jgi:hypothetical protein